MTAEKLSKPVKKKTSYRAMTSLVVTWSFIIASVTGVVLYIVPQGRIANWVIWELWGLTKDGWTDLHVIFSFVFVAVGVAHLVYNWKPFKNYMAERAAGHVHMTKTLGWSLAVTVVFFGLSIFNLPPANWIFDLSDTIKESWVVSPDYEPPFGHAEDVSLAGFAQRQFIDLNAALQALDEAGIEVPEKQMKLKDIAVLNSITPMDIYLVIRPLEQRPKLKARYLPEDVEGQFAGTGIGRKTLAQMAEELEMKTDAAVSTLAARGVTATSDQTMKSIADAHGTEAIELVKMLLIEDHVLP